MPYLAPYQGKITIEPIPLTLYAIVSKAVGTWEQTSNFLRSFLQLTDVCVAHISDIILSLFKEAIAVCIEVGATILCFGVTLVIGVVAHFSMLLVLCAYAIHVVLRKGLGLGTSGKLLMRKPLRRLFYSSLEVFPFVFMVFGIVRYFNVGAWNEWNNSGGLLEHLFANGIRRLHDEFHEVVMRSN